MQVEQRQVDVGRQVLVVRHVAEPAAISTQQRSSFQRPDRPSERRWAIFA